MSTLEGAGETTHDGFDDGFDSRDGNTGHEAGPGIATGRVARGGAERPGRSDRSNPEWPCQEIARRRWVSRPNRGVARGRRRTEGHREPAFDRLERLHGP